MENIYCSDCLSQTICERLGCKYCEDGKILSPSEEIAVAQWFIGDDTGVSSKYMAAIALHGKVILPTRRLTEPQDHGDFGRCLRLLSIVPSIAHSFELLKTCSSVWEVYMEHWDDLSYLYNNEDFAKLDTRLKILRDEANINFPTREK